jgi:hypothetical protein
MTAESIVRSADSGRSWISREYMVAMKITYYAIVNDYSRPDEPGGVLRRVEDENAEYDEQFGHVATHDLVEA